MLRDHIIPKPASIGVYECHQLIEELTGGARPLFADLGDSVVIRSDADLTENGAPVRDVSNGDVIGFELVSSCGTKRKGKHSYFPIKDWRSRRAWLDRKAADAGFEVRAASVSARREQIMRQGKVINIDRTQFTGVLKVTDAAVFRQTIAGGLSGPGRAFGRGMLRI